MKNYTLLVCLSLSLLTSCAIGVETSSHDEQKRKQLTTLEIQEAASKDTVTYKVYEKQNTVYLINPKTNVVQKSVDLSYEWILNFIMTVLFVLCIIGAFVIGSNRY
jgi:hypothetical protein